MTRTLIPSLLLVLASPLARAAEDANVRFTDGFFGSRSDFGAFLVRDVTPDQPGAREQEQFIIVGIEEIGPIPFSLPDLSQGGVVSADTDGGLAQLHGVSGLSAETSIDASIANQRNNETTTLNVDYGATVADFFDSLQLAFDLGWEFGPQPENQLDFELRSYINAEITLDAPAFVNFFGNSISRSLTGPTFEAGGSNPGSISPANIPNWESLLQPGTYTLDIEVELTDEGNFTDISGNFGITFRDIPAPSAALPLAMLALAAARRTR